jgi:hypothetical protein
VIDRHRDRLDAGYVPGKMLLEEEQKRQRIAPAGNGGEDGAAPGKVDPGKRGRLRCPARTI